MNTLVTTKSEIIEKITNELISSTGYIKVSNFWNIVLLLMLSIGATAFLLTYFFEDERIRKEKEVILFHFVPAIGLALLTLIAGVRYNNIILHNKRLGLSPAIIEASITPKTSTLAINISTGADLLEYKSKWNDMSVITPTEDDSVAITLKVPDSTNFLEDTQEFLTVPATTYRINSVKIKSLVTPELIEEIESSVNYGTVTEIHYIPIKKKKKMIESGEITSIKPSDVTVTVNTEVTVK